MREHEDGLISQYVGKVQALGVRAEGGEDVSTETATVVSEACEHFRVVKTSDAQANLSAFVAKLKLTAEVAHASQERFKQTLLHAASICPAKI